MNRIRKLSKYLSNENIDGALITSPININYLSGYDSELPPEVSIGDLNDPTGLLFIHTGSNTAIFFADKRYNGPTLGHNIKTCIVKMGNTLSFLDSCIKIIKDEICDKARLGIEKNGLNYSDGLILIKNLSISNIEITGIDKILLNLRERKDGNEIQMIKKAQNITDNTFIELTKYIKPGMTEINIAIYLESIIIRHGAHLAFQSIVASGKNSATPHHTNSNRKIQKNDILLLDFGARTNGYHSDMTRTIFIGTPTKNMISDYKAVMRTIMKTTTYIENEKNINKISQYTHKLLSHYPTSAYFNFHGLGHGVGLQIHETPVLGPHSQAILNPGNVITIEPGIYKTGIYGIRIEDMICIGSPNVRMTSSTLEPIILN